MAQHVVRRADRRSRGGSLGAVDVADHHLGALGDEPPGDRKADAARAAGDQRHLAAQPFVLRHGSSFLSPAPSWSSAPPTKRAMITVSSAENNRISVTSALISGVKPTRIIA